MGSQPEGVFLFWSPVNDGQWLVGYDISMKLMTPKAGKCHIRLLKDSDYPRLEEIFLEATKWIVDFFIRLRFKWCHRYEDEEENHFFQGWHMVYPNDRKVFQRILDAGEVSLSY